MGCLAIIDPLQIIVQDEFGEDIAEVVGLGVSEDMVVLT